jgi:hypothetical protein
MTANKAIKANIKGAIFNRERIVMSMGLTIVAYSHDWGTHLASINGNAPENKGVAAMLARFAETGGELRILVDGSTHILTCTKLLRYAPSKCGERTLGDNNKKQEVLNG